MSLKSLEDLTLSIKLEMRVRASLEMTFAALLEQVGPQNETPEGRNLQMVLEPWPGGRWFRDLGNKNGHFWGNVQAIKRPTLLELSGPLFASSPLSSNLQYRLSEIPEGTLITLRHTAFGFVMEGEEIAAAGPAGDRPAASTTKPKAVWRSVISVPSGISLSRYWRLESIGDEANNGPDISSSAGRLMACTWAQKCPLPFPRSRNQRPPGHGSSTRASLRPSGVSNSGPDCSSRAANVVSIDAWTRVSSVMESVRSSADCMDIEPSLGVCGRSVWR